MIGTVVGIIACIGHLYFFPFVVWIFLALILAIFAMWCFVELKPIDEKYELSSLS